MEDKLVELKASNFLLENKEKLKQIIKILSDDFEYVSILGTDVLGSFYEISTSGTKLGPSEDVEKGFVIRVMQDTGFSEYSFNEINIDRICNKVRQIAKEDREKYLKIGPKLEYPNKIIDEKAKLFSLGRAKIIPGQENPDEIINILTNTHDGIEEYITGGAISENIFEQQANMKFSSEREYGILSSIPKAIVFE